MQGSGTGMLLRLVGKILLLRDGLKPRVPGTRPPGSEHSEPSQIVPASGSTSHLCHSENGLFLLPMMGHPGFSGFSEFGH